MGHQYVLLHASVAKPHFLLVRLQVQGHIQQFCMNMIPYNEDDNFKEQLMQTQSVV